MAEDSFDSMDIMERTFDAIPDLVAILDTQHRIVRANRAMAEGLGKEPEELVGAYCYREVHGTQEPPAFCPHTKLIKEGLSTTAEIYEDRLGGNFLISVTPFFDSRGELAGSVHVARDISELKRIEAALKEANVSLEEKIAERTAELSKSNIELQNEIQEHRYTEEKLRKTEQHYKTVADFTYDWEFWVAKDESYLYCSPSCERITGYTPDDFLADPDLFAKIILPEDRPTWKEHGHAAHQDPTLREVKVRIRTKSGEVRWIEHACQPVKTPGGESLGYRASNRDITLTKKAEDALRLSESRLAEAQMIARLGNWDWNITENSLYWSDEIYRIFGLKPQEFGATYEAFLKSVHPADRDGVEQAVNQALYEDQPYSIDHRIVLPDGNIRIVHEQAQVTFNEEGKAVRMMGTVQDITDQKKIEHELADRLAYERLYSEMSATFGSLPLSKLDSAMERSLERLTEYFDVDRVTILEFNEDRSKLKPLYSCAVPGVKRYTRTDSDRLFPWVFERLSGGETLVWEDVLAEIPPDASLDRDYVQKIGIKSYISIPLTLGGKADYAIAMGTFERPRNWPEELIQRFRHLGELFAHVLVRRRVENRARELRGQMTHMTRVTTMGELAGALAHEINQPLAAIMSNAQAARRFLEAKDPDIEELEEILTDIADDTTRASEVIMRLRTMMTGSKGAVETLSINNVIQEVLPLMHRDAEGRKVSMDLDMSPDLPLVSGDKIQLQQVLLNLMLNGFDAMMELAPEDRVLTIRTSQEDETNIQVAVQDVGSGIETGELNQIFDPFFTTKSQGMGLGLSINRTIIQAHGGRLWAENNRDQGATFYFTLPILRK
jgi:PAS domain S-box-containing protein